MPTRQLAAIMFTDIVGYTDLLQADEVTALHLFDKLKKRLESEAKKHNGRILEITGSGALSSFKSTLEAVRAALSVQIEMQRAPVVPLRMAIHIGDVVIEGDSIYGDGVNIASRMESLAVPGSILISDRVYDDIKNQKDLVAIHLGKYHLKNVKEDLDLYAMTHPGIVTPEATSLEGKGEKSLQKSILVLPCVNLSSDPEQEYFSDGLTEEMISSFSRLPELRVFSRTTSMNYKGTAKDIPTISGETGATYIIEGSVRTQGNKLRITAQIIDAQLDHQLWSETYSGTLDDIFDIQEKVASKIADALRLQLTVTEKNALLKRYTGNTQAYQLYLQGRFFWNKRNEAGLKTALRFFEQAIEKDPEYALAYAGIGDTYNLLGEFTNISRREVYPKARAAIERALEIDNQLAEAHISYGLQLMLNEWDWENAGKEFRIGLELNPNYATGHHWYSEWLLYLGRTEEALHVIATAVELDPVSPAILKDHGICLYYTRQYDEGIEKAKKALTLDPDFFSAYRLLSLCYEGKGMWEEAIHNNQMYAQHIQNHVKSDLFLAHIYAAAGRRKEALDLITKILTHEELHNNDYRSMALVYAALGEIDQAFHWLDQSCQRHEESLDTLKVDPKMDPLRSDPRFDELMRKVGILS